MNVSLVKKCVVCGVEFTAKRRYPEKSHCSRKCSRQTHGLRWSPEYTSWASMNTRCNNPKSKGYMNYGGRGITICKRWGDFKNFYADMGPKPTKYHSIERIDNKGNYTPDNCKWATFSEQSHNKRNSRTVSYEGESMTISEWGKRIGVHIRTLFHRFDSGWSTARALTTKTKVKS